MRHATYALMLLLSGCALWPLTEADCRPPSWQQRGYDDGFGGAPPQDMRLTRECSRLGIQVSEAEYLNGWREGRAELERLQKRGDGDRQRKPR
jgi:hypothetical protein